MTFRKQASTFMILAFFVPGVLAGERFSLDVPGQPGLGSLAELEGATLVIVDASGQKHRYTRDPNADSRDGRFRGYYSQELKRYLRFPVAGQGAMQFADKDGARVWRTSQMQVSRMANHRPSGTPGVPGAANLDPFAPGAQHGRPLALPAHLAFHASHFSVLPRGDDYCLGVLDRRGEFHFYFGRGDQWKQQTTRPVRGIDFEGSFVLASDPQSNIPFVYGVSAGGELLAIRNGSEVRSVFAKSATAPSFVRDTQLSTLDDGRLVAAVDDRGRCLLMSPQDGRLVDAGPFRSRAVPGSPVSVIPDGKRGVHAFLIDGGGQLLHLSLRPQGGWDEKVLGDRFAPGGYVTVSQLSVAGRASQTYVASVNSRGVVQLLREPFQRVLTVDAIRLAPGAPIVLSHRPTGELTLAAVDGRGALAEWSYAGRWARREIGIGFAPGAAVWFDGLGPACFAINRQGTLISGYFFAGHWACHDCGVIAGLVGYASPTVIHSEVVPLPPLPPVEIRLENPHREDVVVQWGGALRPGAEPETIDIPAGTSIRRQVQRDAGAKRVETVRVRRFDGTLVEEVREYRIPAQPLSTLAVFENRIQSVYIDRTGKDPTPGSVTRGLRSLGAFRLPPGNALRDGQVINVYQEAVSRRNPGAVRWLP